MSIGLASAEELELAGFDPFRLAAGFEYDPLRAEQAVGFFEHCLVHVKGELAGTPIFLEEWQKRFVRNLYGWRDDEGFRRFLEFWLYIPRKNAKSTKAAGLALLEFFAGGEPGAEVYTGAADQAQAGIIFDVAVEMIRASPRLARKSTIRQNVVTRRGPETGLSIFRALSSEVASKHGYNASVFLADEVHAHRGSGLWEVMTTSQAARRAPLTGGMTTADFARESLCNSKHAYAQGVRDGTIDDPRFLPCIFETPVSADWTDPDVWRHANPNLGVSVSEDYIRRMAERARREPSFENTFRRLHLNCQTEQAERWLPLDRWRACGVERLELEDFAGARAVLGLDLASTNDLAALVAICRRGDDVVVFARHYAPKDRANERLQRGQKPDYFLWERQGWLTLTPTPAIDYGWIVRDVLEFCRVFDVQKVGMDPWNAHAVAAALDERSIDVEFVRQGFSSLNAPSKELERLIVSGHLRHGSNPVLSWMAGNVSKTEDPAGNIKPDKRQSGEKIDGIVALIVALALVEELDDPGWEISVI